MSNTKLYTFAANVLIDLYYKALQWRAGADARRSSGALISDLLLPIVRKNVTEMISLYAHNGITCYENFLLDA